MSEIDRLDLECLIEAGGQSVKLQGGAHFQRRRRAEAIICWPSPESLAVTRLSWLPVVPALMISRAI